MAAGPGSTRRRVAIFGGSFNPPHKGHAEIIKWIFMKGQAEEVWVIPCYEHPLGKDLAPFADRMAMAKLAFAKLSLPVQVSDVEEQLGGESRTLVTIEHLVDRNPDKRFILVVGEDIDGEADKWHRFDKIKALVDVMKVPRGPGSPIPDVSSTGVREAIASGDTSWRQMVEPEVAVYIVTKALYRSS